MKSGHKYENWAKILKVGTNIKSGHKYEKDYNSKRF